MVGHLFNEMPEAADDEALLQMYATHRSQDAFAELVRRHIPLVYGSALRQLGDAHLAEDVSQIVFTLLATKAGSVRGRRLCGWLFAATRYACANELRSARRRRRHERSSARREITVSDANERADTMGGLLDEALARLNASDREAILMRYFQGLDAASIARAMGVSEPAARKRLARAVCRLRRLFAAAGLALALEDLDGALPPRLVVPPALAKKIAAAALSPPSHCMVAVRNVAKAKMLRTLLPVAALVATVAVVIVAAWLVIPVIRARSTTRADRIIIPLRPVRPNLNLTLAWNKTSYAAPVPASFPDELKQTASYQDWERRRDARSFIWSTRDGRRYVARAEVRQENGGSTAFISDVQLFRTDGTLQTETINDSSGEPRQWLVYTDDGHTRRIHVSNHDVGDAGDPFIAAVRLFNPDGTSREYRANRYGQIYEEWLLDSSGRAVRLLNGGKQFNAATAPQSSGGQP
jgi:RNA polymerase sigma factor (sigma-70 family)